MKNKETKTVEYLLRQQKQKHKRFLRKMKKESDDRLIKLWDSFNDKIRIYAK